MTSQFAASLVKLSSGEWADLARRKREPEACCIELPCVSTAKAVPDAGGKKLIKFTISTDTQDRQRDIIEVGGWDLTQHKRNPVILWAHDYKNPPIARARETRIEGHQLVSVADFTESSQCYPFAATVYEMVKSGLLNASSVGFRPLEYDLMKEGGIRITRAELLEWSIVPIPANAEALVQLSLFRESGLSRATRTDDTVIEIEGPLDVAGQTITRAVSERMATRLAAALTPIYVNSGVEIEMSKEPDEWALEIEECFDVDPENVQTAVRAAVRATVGEIVKAEVRAAIQYACGRVD